MNTRMVAIGSCLLLTSFVACSGDDSNGPGATDAGVDAGEVTGGSGGGGGKGGSGGHAGSAGEAQGGSGGTAVGGAGSGGAPAEMQYTVGGQVSGLAGSGLLLKLNGSHELSVTKNGDFSFDTQLSAGADYAVTVGTQPSNPVQACTVDAGSGKIGDANVTNVKITCNTATRTIGGSLSGVGGATVVLKNGSEMLSLSADGAFTFQTAVKQGDNYAVTVQTQPSGHSCAVAQGSGTAGTSNVTNVSVTCYADLKLLAKARVGGVKLSWDTNGATAYNVLVSTDAACNWDNAGSCAGADHKDNVSSPYLWTGLTDGTPYYFQVRGTHANDFVTRSAAVGTRPNRAQIDNTLLAAATNAGTTYVGGKFTSIGVYTGTAVPVDAQTGLTTRIPNFPTVANTVYAVISDGNNGYFIGGEFTQIGGAQRAHLAHILANGDVDSNFHPDPDAYVSVLALSGSTLFVGGNFANIAGQARAKLAAVNTGTGALSSWNPAPDQLVTAMVATADTLYVGGEYANIGGQARSLLSAFPLTNGEPGTIKSDFTPNPNGVRILALYLGNGVLYVSGYFSTIAGQSRDRVAAFNATSGELTSFAPNPDQQVNAFALLGNTLFVAGRFTSILGANLGGVAALDAGTGLARSDWNPAPDGEVFALAAANDTLYLGGAFQNIASTARRGLAALAASGAVSVKAWNPQPDGDIGNFTLSGDTLYVLGDTRTYGAEPRSKLASFTGGSLTDWAPQVNGGDVMALALNGSSVLAAGDFETIGSAARQGVAAIDGNGAATTWNAQVNSGGNVYALAVDGSHVYLGGEFTAAGGGNRANLAALALDTGSAAGGWAAPDPDQPVRALAAGGDLLYLGGDFQNLGNSARAHLGAVQTSNGAIAGWNPGANGRVLALAVVKNTDVYVGGEFTQLSSTTRNRLGSVEAMTGTLNPWDPNLDAKVHAFAHAGNFVFAVGEFSSLGPGTNPVVAQTGRRSLAVFDDGTGELQTSFPNLSDTGFAVAADDTYLYLGGDFTSVGGLACSRYYRYGY